MHHSRAPDEFLRLDLFDRKAERSAVGRPRYCRQVCLLLLRSADRKGPFGALQRSELTKISQWWSTPDGHLSLPPARADFVTQQPHSLSPWVRLHSRLVDGEAFADFELEK